MRVLKWRLQKIYVFTLKTAYANKVVIFNVIYLIKLQ